MSNKQKYIFYRTDQAWKYNTSLAVGSFAVLIAVELFIFTRIKVGSLNYV